MVKQSKKKSKKDKESALRSEAIVAILSTPLMREAWTAAIEAGAAAAVAIIRQSAGNSKSVEPSNGKNAKKAAKVALELPDHEDSPD
jgi:hypothetical protein